MGLMPRKKRKKRRKEEKRREELTYLVRGEPTHAKVKEANLVKSAPAAIFSMVSQPSRVTA